MWLTILWSQRQLIAEILGGILIAFFCWWFFWHNPQKIKGLEADKAELSRQVENGQRAIKLLSDIQNGRQANVEKVAIEIKKIQQDAVPKRHILIPAGMLPSGDQTSAATNRATAAVDASRK